MTTEEILQAGGVLAFASLVLYTLRELRPILQALRDELFEMRITLAAILERERIRDTRRKREDSEPGRRLAAATPLAQTSAGSVPRFVDPDDETTDIVTLIERQRTAANAKRGERKPRAGTHHDES